MLSEKRDAVHIKQFHGDIGKDVKELEEELERIEAEIRSSDKPPGDKEGLYARHYLISSELREKIAITAKIKPFLKGKASDKKRNKDNIV